MSSPFHNSIFACLVLLIAVMGHSQSLNAQSDPTAQLIKAQREYTDEIRPLLEEACSDCHWAGDSDGGVNLEPYLELDEILRNNKLWLKVLKETKTGKMPPDDGPELESEDRSKVVRWLDNLLNNIDCSEINPGSVTIRRLNRTEYRNTIRDLTGIDYKAADKFPGDDVGYGFDNIADTLSLPPILMEKYLNAAEKIALRAIPDTSKRQLDTYINGNDIAPVESTAVNRGIHVFASNGRVRPRVEFPKSGTYEISILASGTPADGVDPDMKVYVGDKEIADVTVSTKEYKKYTFLTKKIPAGWREIGIEFTNDAYIPERKQDRNLFVQRVSVTGPMVAAKKKHSNGIIFLPGDGDAKQQTKNAIQVISRFAGRAFRRPVYQTELEKLVQLYQLARKSGDDYEGGIRFAITAVLVSPKFIYKIENPVQPNTTRSLTDFELAQSLSYFLWSSMPDDRLFKIAAAGKLSDPKIYRSEVIRMIKDPRSRALVDDFAEQWLQLRIVADIQPDSDLFPRVNRRLRADMVQETKLLFDHVLKTNGPVTELVSADYTFVNSRLAKHYGIDNVTSRDFVRRTTPDRRAAGLLTHASVLTLTSNPDRTSPVKRGKWILENLLGEEPPPPDPDVMQLEDQPALTGNLRQRMLQHRANPSCAGCHTDMDALGFALEHFDAVGRWRDSDDGVDIDASGKLSDGTEFNGVVELKQVLNDQLRKQFVRTLSEKMLIYSLGRGLEYFDQCAVDEILKRLEAKDDRFSELIFAIVESQPFRKRRGAAR